MNDCDLLKCGAISYQKNKNGVIIVISVCRIDSFLIPAAPSADTNPFYWNAVFYTVYFACAPI